MLNSKQFEYVGRINQLNNDTVGKIIAFRTPTDLDVLCDNGLLYAHQSLQDFEAGVIRANDGAVIITKPTQSKETQKANVLDDTPQNTASVSSSRSKRQPTKAELAKRESMVKKMNNGMKARIINYRGAKDIDVQWETGAISYSVQYGSFDSGVLTYPSMTNQIAMDRYGQKKTMNCGLIGQIIAYRNANDIDVLIDKKVYSHKRYANFIDGRIGPKTHLVREEKDIIGQTKLMRCGLNSTIIATNGLSDITIRFEDGAEREHIRYTNWASGAVAHPQKTKIQPIVPVEPIKETKPATEAAPVSKAPKTSKKSVNIEKALSSAKGSEACNIQLTRDELDAFQTVSNVLIRIINSQHQL